MKPIGLSIIAGIILAGSVIYVLRPLNAGAVTLVVMLSIGISSAVGTLIAYLRKGTSTNENSNE